MPRKAFINRMKRIVISFNDKHEIFELDGNEQIKLPKKSMKKRINHIRTQMFQEKNLPEEINQNKIAISNEIINIENIGKEIILRNNNIQDEREDNLTKNTNVILQNEYKSNSKFLNELYFFRFDFNPNEFFDDLVPNLFDEQDTFEHEIDNLMYY